MANQFAITEAQIQQLGRHLDTMNDAGKGIAALLASVAVGADVRVSTGSDAIDLRQMTDGDQKSGAVSQAAKPLTAMEVLKAMPKSGFVYGKASLAEMQGVIPILLEVANLGLTISTQDWKFFDGVRTPAQQVANIKAGTSKTMDSKHLPQKDGFAHAMDLVPIIGGIAKWDWDGCYKIALAIDLAATALGVADRIVWGAVWDKRLSEYGNNPDAYKKAVYDYQQRHPGPDFIDGPHFEWRA